MSAQLIEVEESTPLNFEMNGPKDLMAGYRRFRTSTYKKQVNIYQQLGSSQSPKILIIACADSRVDPAAIFDCAPGQLFVIRNVANLVPPYNSSPTLHGVSAALEYAVKALKVKHIVVMGHGGCGGVKASLDGLSTSNDSGFEFIGPWVGLLDSAREKVLHSGSVNPQYALELEGIETSIDNLQSFPFVKDAIDAGEIELHGAWFAIQHGELHWRNNNNTRFEVVPNLCVEIKKPNSMKKSTSSPMLTSKKSFNMNSSDKGI